MSIKKPKLLVVNNNMYIGGVQKTLISLLTAIENQYDITLLLFYAHGELMGKIPKGVHVVETKGNYKYLGMQKKDCQKIYDKLYRLICSAIGNVFGLKWAMKLINIGGCIDDLGHYDAIISYLHCSSLKSFYGGTLEYVIRYEDTAPKSCYLHCDYANSGTVSSYSKDLYRKFDAIICVSESVRKQFTTILPEMSNRAYTISNPINSNEILALSRYEPYQYDMRYLNCLTVARLSAEKGVDRFIRVIKRVGNMQIRYYIVGEGSFRPQIEQAIAECDLKSQVFLLGESENPYRYMIGADVLIVPSYHEAAPVVFQEAMILGLPVFTTRTLSAEEMIPNTCGFIVDSNENAMTEMLNKIICDRTMLSRCRRELYNYCCIDECFSTKFQCVFLYV